MPPADETSLDSLPDLPKHLLALLRASSITTAEQFIAASAATGGADSMARYLKVDRDEFIAALAAAEAAVPAAERKRLSTPVDVRDYGLGALPPERSE